MAENINKNIEPKNMDSVPLECLHSENTTEAPRLVNKEKRSMNDNLSPTCLKKKKKTRRGKNKRKNKLTNKLQYKKLSKKDLNRVKNVRAQIVEMGHKLVPYNTNQFLMEEHMPEPQPMLSVQFRSPRIPYSRSIDSEFILENEENYYCSPTDEDDFLDKEFSNVYETAQCERLDAMQKTQLIEEYLIMESRVDQLTKSLRQKRVPETSITRNIMNKIKEQTEKIQTLLAENEGLRQENAFLSEKLGPVSPSSDSSCSSMTSPSSADEQCFEGDLPYPRRHFLHLNPAVAPQMSP